MEGCLSKRWGRAVDQLPYDSAEGGYQGKTWSTAELFFDHLEIQLPRDNKNALYTAICSQLGFEPWCDLDWMYLDPDEALRFSWARFCDNVKYHRRYFFHHLGESTDEYDPNSYSPQELLTAIAQLSAKFGLIRELPAGTPLWRARADIRRYQRTTPLDFGPPPAERALQSNRMNPPGISMMYAASSPHTAKLETRATSAKVGLWRTLRGIRILDLRTPPNIPGIFSDESDRNTLAAHFLFDFRYDIMTPVVRDERIHIDYLPSQIVSEFLRDFPFREGRLDGIAYGSTVTTDGWNIALFVNKLDVTTGSRARPAVLKFQKAIRI